MNKENENVARRFGSQNHHEYRSEAMHSMSEPTGEIEPTPSEREAEAQGFLHNYTAAVATLSATFAATIIISIIVARMWDEDQIKLHVLDYMIKMLQAIARLCGGWALECERTYNEYVNALH